MFQCNITQSWVRLLSIRSRCRHFVSHDKLHTQCFYYVYQSTECRIAHNLTKTNNETVIVKNKKLHISLYQPNLASAPFIFYLTLPGMCVSLQNRTQIQSGQPSVPIHLTFWVRLQKVTNVWRLWLKFYHQFSEWYFSTKRRYLVQVHRGLNKEIFYLCINWFNSILTKAIYY